MKILFLDIDGVLNRNHNYGGNYDYPRVDKDLAARLEQVVQSTGCKIVLTSNWKGIIPLGDTARRLRDAGITAPVISRTEFLDSRGAEVDRWFKTSAWSEEANLSYAIVDDRRDYFPSQPTVFTQGDHGLQPEHVDRLIGYLGAK